MEMTTPDKLNQWAEEFAASVIGQHESILGGDRLVSNEHANRYNATFKKLRESGDQGRDALAGLFTHPHPGVRMAAAAYLLRYRTDEAMQILKDLASGKGLVALEAQEAINRWSDGTWGLDS